MVAISRAAASSAAWSSPASWMSTALPDGPNERPLKESASTPTTSPATFRQRLLNSIPPTARSSGGRSAAWMESSLAEPPMPPILVKMPLITSPPRASSVSRAAASRMRWTSRVDSMGTPTGSRAVAWARSESTRGRKLVRIRPPPRTPAVISSIATPAAGMK